MGDRLKRSPSLERLLDRRPSFSRPPIRSVASPKLTEDEAMQLTSPFLRYRTRYTYASSRCYDGESEDDGWEVPNLANNSFETQTVTKTVHHAAPSYIYHVWLYICWIVSVISYFVQKFFTLALVEGPKSVLILFYDLLVLIFTAVSSVFRSIGNASSSAVSGSSTVGSSVFTGVSKVTTSVASALERTPGALLEGLLWIQRPFRSIYSFVYQVLTQVGIFTLSISRSLYDKLVDLIYFIAYLITYPFRAVYNTMSSVRRSSRTKAKKVSYSPVNHMRHFDVKAAASTVSDDSDDDILENDNIHTPPVLNSTRRRKNIYSLRNRLITGSGTDTEDEGFSERAAQLEISETPRARRNMRHQSVEYEESVSMSHKIATWLGHVASTIVAFIYWVLIEFLMIFSRGFSAIQTGLIRIWHEIKSIFVKDDVKAMYTRQSTEHTSTRRSSRRITKTSTFENEETFDDTHAPAFISSLVSFFSYPFRMFWLLFSTIFRWIFSTVLIVLFGIVDVFRSAKNWIVRHFSDQAVHEDVVYADGVEPVDFEEAYRRNPVDRVLYAIWKCVAWVWNALYNTVKISFLVVEELVKTAGLLVYGVLSYLVNGVVSTARNVVGFATSSGRWKWLLLLLLLLIPLFLLAAGKREQIEEKVVSIKEKIHQHYLQFYDTVDPDQVYAKGLNSIYDEYYLHGQNPIYSWSSRIRNAFNKFFLSIANFFYDVYYFIGAWLRVLWEWLIASFSGLYQSIYGFYAKCPPFMETTKYLLVKYPGALGMYIIRQWNATVAYFQTRPVYVPPVVYQPPAPPPVECPKVESPPPVVVPVMPPTTVDEEALIREITAKVQAEMNLKMQTMLEASHKQIVADVIKNIPKTPAGEFDYSKLDAKIRAEIFKYDADKTGLFDYALESAGASIISTRCSDNYNTYSRLEKIWNIPLWYSSYGPRTVIQRNSNSLFPGECWSFRSGTGYLTVDLSHAINITMISYEHISKDQAPDGNRSSAPKKFKFWAYKYENDLETRHLLGEFEYILEGTTPLQYFVITSTPDYPVKIVELEINSNYGAEYTCLYRLRVHGDVYKPKN